MFMRSDHMNNFTMAQNDLIQDDRLSLEARGLMMYILSLPDDWAFSVKGLANQCKVSEATVNRLVNELKDGDPTSLAPHERLTDLAVVPRDRKSTRLNSSHL